jgi:hypothetical protein
MIFYKVPDRADPLRLSDWLALPAGAELDRIVAERVMGWGWTTIHIAAGSDALGEWVEGHDQSGPVTYPGGYFPRTAWHPSTNIAHAWEVVEGMRPRTLLLDQISDTADWAAIFGEGCEPVMHAPTAPLAIVLAALAACCKSRT